MTVGFRGFFTSGEGRFRRLLVVFLALGLGALVVVGITALGTVRRSGEYTGSVNHTYDVRVSIAQAETLIERGETARRGYLLTSEDRYVQVHEQAWRDLGPTLKRLEILTGDNPGQAVRLVNVRRLLSALDAARRATISATRTGLVESARLSFVNEGNTAQLAQIRTLLSAMEREEDELLVRRSADQETNLRTFYAILAAAGLILVLVVSAAVLLVLRYTRDLDRSRANLSQLNDTLEEQVLTRTADLSLANEEIQRFAYIVSHDLRSPLVNVMGFTAELSAAVEPLQELIARAEATAPQIITDEARLAAREDLPEAIGFIRSSTAKMDRLINAILQLSRQGRRTLAAEDLDLAVLVDGVIATMRHVIDDRGVTVTVGRPMPTIKSDRLAVEQIVSNLIENATKYLQSGRTGQITVSAQTKNNRVLISVEDNGRGIDPRDHQRIFDLFRRSGSQDQAGEGIGLAHVRALAYRLGGAINVASELGVGSTFTLSLPKQLDQEVKL